MQFSTVFFSHERVNIGIKTGQFYTQIALRPHLIDFCIYFSEKKIRVEIARSRKNIVDKPIKCVSAISEIGE